MNTKNILAGTILLVTAWLSAARTEAQNVTAISAGQLNSFFLRSDGTVWGTGVNNYGQMGNGTNSIVFTTNRPTQIPVSNIAAISAGYGHMLFLQSNGVMLGTGYNLYGQLGTGTNTNISTPTPIASNVMAIAAGELDSFYIDNNHVLWGTGDNSFGALGNGTNIPSYQFQQILTGVTAAAGGGQHSVFLRTDGSVWGAGSDEQGQFGLGAGNAIITNLPTKIIAGGVAMISAGEFNTMYITTDSNLWGMGSDVYGQLGDGNTAPYAVAAELIDSNVAAVSSGEVHTLYIKGDGSLWAMGYNAHGELGNGNFNNTNRPQLILASNVVAVSGGDDHTLFQKADGSVWAMGANQDGQLADRTTTGGTNVPEEIILGTDLPAGFGNLSYHGTNVFGQLFFNFVGLIGTNYALDRTTNLIAPNWLPQFTNQAGANGKVSFTNSIVAKTNNFWRIREVLK
jgi:alpha-tubulin suppressor-like RCC1 family protein